MPKATKSSASGNNHLFQVKEMVLSSQEELSSSEQEPDPEVSFYQVRPPQPVLSMVMSYIEGPKMDWTVNDGLYHRFLKWCLKYENILECAFAALPKWQQCKKVIAWNGDFGMDQYASWCLPAEELTLDTIWGKFEEFFKPQSNEVWAHFDLLTSFRQGDKSIDEWYNVVQTQVNLAKYPQKQPRSCTETNFWFFLRDEKFISRTISDGNVDLDKFQASKVWQLAERIENPKATTCHIKQVASDPQAVQINLLRHQHTELPAGKYKKKKCSVKPRQSNYLIHGNENSQVPSQHKKWFDAKNAHQNKDSCSKCGDSAHVEGLQCPSKKFQCKDCHKFGHLHQPLLSEKASSFLIQKAKSTPTTSRGCIWQKKCHLQSIWR